MRRPGFMSAEEALAYFDELTQTRPVERPLGVAELLTRITNILAPEFSGIAVRGEIHSVTRSAAGHIYFDLKDEREEAHLNCAMFRGNAARLTFLPRQGDKVEISGEVNIYAPRGQLNFVVRTMKKAGEGDLYAQFAALKAKLLAEGLFDAALKRAIPRFPCTIGIVTSPQAAALRDVIRTIRGVGVGVNLILYPAGVQGDAAEGELLAALATAEKHHACDVLLLVRGGGSLADLWTFNSEKIARRLRKMTIPVISGVGHETDTTIADLAADVRAATPTAAATLAMSGWHLAKATVPENERRLRGLIRGVVTTGELRLTRTTVFTRLFERRMETWERRIDAAASAVAHLPQRVLTDKERQLSRLTERLSAAAPAADKEAAKLERLKAKLTAAVRRSVQREVQAAEDLRLQLVRLRPETAAARERVSAAEKLLARSARGDITLRHEQTTALEKRLKALAPDAVLSRGYALAIDAAGRVVTDAAKLKTGDALRVRLKIGAVATRVETVQQ